MSRLGIRQWLLLYIKGVAMGVAEIIPGVSGGTIAFITGIYPELLRTLAGLHPGQLPVLWQEGPRAFWQRLNLSFLLVLGLGMLCSVLLLAQVLQYLLATMPVVIWAFFFGLILAACFDIGRQNTPLHLLTAGLPGLLFGLTLALLGAGQSDPASWLIFVGGAIAITAWLLPGVSGSYMLLLLGLYPIVVGAIAELNISILVTLALGMLLGLMLFAQLLSWLLHHYYYPVLALLTGFMAGSLPTLWPWRIPDSAEGLRLTLPVGPSAYTEATGLDPAIWPACMAVLAGMLMVYLLTRMRHPSAVGYEQSS